MFVALVGLQKSIIVGFDVFLVKNQNQNWFLIFMKFVIMSLSKMDLSPTQS